MPEAKPVDEVCDKETKVRLNTADDAFLEALAATSGVAKATLGRHFIKQQINAIKQAKASLQITATS